MTQRRNDPFRPVCLYPPGRALLPGDLAAIQEFEAYLEALSWATGQRVEALARARHALVAKAMLPAEDSVAAESSVLEWEGLEPRDRAAALVRARGWLIAAHMAGLVGETEESGA